MSKEARILLKNARRNFCDIDPTLSNLKLDWNVTPPSISQSFENKFSKQKPRKARWN